MPKRFCTIFTVVLLPALFCAVLLGRNLIYPREAHRPAPDPPEVHLAGMPEDSIVVYYHERRPYYVTTPNQVHGLIADRVNWVFREAGIPYEWRKTPAKRELALIRSNDQQACAAGWFKSPEREAFGRFTLPIFMDSPTLALARADNDQIQSGGSLAGTLSNRRLRLLRKDGYSYGKFIDDAIRRLAPREIVTTAENLSMVKIIHSHRADYFFIAKEEAEDLILYSGLPFKDFKMIHFSDMPRGNKRYLICSRRIDTLTLLRLNRAIKDYLLGSLASPSIDVSTGQ